jgi:2-polyprenyl-6-hydroxyphenyl methylase/3-demethylubiquinone-9 3-methyltransferase
MAAEWWDPNGKFKPLHMLNPCRLDYITRRSRRSSAATSRPTALRGAAASRYRLRRRVFCRTDGAAWVPMSSAPTPPNATSPWPVHAEQSGLDIDYRHTTAEALAAAGEQFDVVLNMEVVEHVADPQGLPRRLPGASEARRADDLLDHQPQPEEFRDGHRRGGIRDALAAARHP